jgi:hypothetical protein
VVNKTKKLAKAPGLDKKSKDVCCVCLFPGEKKEQLADHALLQRGFDLGTPEGAEGGWATREEGGNERGRKHLCTTPAANTRSSAGRISNRRLEL